MLPKKITNTNISTRDSDSYTDIEYLHKINKLISKNFNVFI